MHAELLSIQQLRQHAADLAAQHRVERRPGKNQLLPRLAANEAILMAAHGVVMRAATAGQAIMPAETWLLDNFYLIEQQVALARRHLPREYSRQLPRLLEGSSAGYPRVYDLALDLISHQDGRVERDNVGAFVAAYQTVDALSLGELWAFPTMLRLGLIENISRVALRIARRREERDEAVAWADRVLAVANDEPRRLIHVLAAMAEAPVSLTSTFVEELYARLQAQGAVIGFVQAWLEHQLAQEGVSTASLLEVASRTAASDQISIANSIGSLRFISALDWGRFVEEMSPVEHVLRGDPAGLYASQDFVTRDRYRHTVEALARDTRYSETQVAETAVALAQAVADQAAPGSRAAHVGYYFIDPGRPTLERAVKSRVPLLTRFTRLARPLRVLAYLLPMIVLTAAAMALPLYHALTHEQTAGEIAFFVIVGLFAATALVVPVVNLLITITIPPRVLPRLDFSKGIPEEHRTMVVIPTLVGCREDVEDLLEALEVRYLGNRDPNLFFALLTDFRDAPEETQPGDDELVELLRSGIETLNDAHAEDGQPGIFYLFHRPRVWNPRDRVWMGWERKRGKLEQFNALLMAAREAAAEGGGAGEGAGVGAGEAGAGEAPADAEAFTSAAQAFSDIVSNRSVLSGIRYVITLDTDTQLPRDAAHLLIGNMAHPLVRPVYDAVRRRVVHGWAILQPRTSISLTSTSGSLFTRLFAGEAGIDPYTREISDVYQDLFGEGSYVGKGIYHVETFHKVLGGRLPENLVLSHDLLEGCHVRSALVTDVDFIEEHPISYVQEASRRHRWTRGDWQIAGWLLPRVPGPSGRRRPNPLSLLSKWKLFDNLRRSLLPAALIALLVGGWFWQSGFAWLWPVLVAGALFGPPLLTGLIELVRKPAERGWLLHLSLTAKSLTRPLLRALLGLMLLPYDAYIYLSAIFRSATGMFITRRGLLVWHLPSYKRRNARRTLLQFFYEMWIAPALAIGLGVALAGPTATRLIDWPWVVPLLALWLVAPLVAWWISKPVRPAAAELDSHQQALLRALARRTWRYFTDFVGPADGWLPPDNYQEYPTAAVAHRTSPTNIGMALLANLAAHDFGYICTGEFLRRTERTFRSMDRLERFRGHFRNWYDTQTLEPLTPEYISAVDSGNLAGSLTALRAGLAELKEQPALSPRVFQGIEDTFLALTARLPASPPVALQRQHSVVRALLHKAISGHNQSTDPARSPAKAQALLEELCHATKELIDKLPADSAREVRYWARTLNRQCRRFNDDLRLLVPDAASRDIMPDLEETAPARILKTIDMLTAHCQDMADMDFDLVYDRQRQLLNIGYDIGERRRDPSWYDLLASEARLTSYLLVAQDQVPQKHWFALSRMLTSRGGDLSLMSWSGSMFEYLMPLLFLPGYENTLLDQACRAAVARHIQYAHQRHVPWGISESCYNAVDMNQIYQYRAFGVPGLGFKTGLADDLVIAPYATALALTVAPREACRNLQTLISSGFLGEYGLYEAIDYTPSRVPPGANHAIVRSFMTHHQGMILLSLAHVLLERPVQRRFTSDPLMRTADLLLQERIPKQTVTVPPHATQPMEPPRARAAEAAAIHRVTTDPDAPLPEVHLLSNGRYHVMATHAGGGYSRWRDLAVTRWREDATCDNHGTFVYLRDRATGAYWSTTHQPTLRKPQRYEAVFIQARTEYRRRDHDIEAHTEISVSPEDDVEIRRIKLTNLSDDSRDIELTSYAEVVMAPLDADLAHRTFSNLFVSTEIVPEHRAILCHRRPRSPGEVTPWMFHLLSSPTPLPRGASYETDRARFLGRGRTPVAPAALEVGLKRTVTGTSVSGPAELSNTEGPVLEPIVAIRTVLALRPDESRSVHLITGVAETREEAMATIRKYHDRHFVDRAFEMAWFESQEILRLLNITEADAHVYGHLTTSVIHATALHRASAGIIARNQLGQSGLWRFGISGDLPIILVRIGDRARIEIVKQALRAHGYWRNKGLTADLVILNEDYSGYRAVLQDEIMGLINSGPEAQFIDKPGGVFVRRAEELTEEDRVLFQAVARVVLAGSAESMAEQVQRRPASERLPARLEPSRLPGQEKIQPLPRRERIFANGLGGFSPDGREYVINMQPGQSTPAPWANVIASPHVGTVVSEKGGSFTWAENAHEFRLTTFHNDPVSDSSGEAIYLRDDETGAIWSPTPLPAPGLSGYVCRHGFGYSVFEHDESGLETRLTTYVAMNAPVKFWVVKLSNRSGRNRRLSLAAYWELVLGEWRHTNLMHIVTEKDPDTGALFARNAYSRRSPGKVVFAQVSEARRTVTGNRTEFLGRNGSLADPAGLRRVHLSGRTGSGLDPCAAIQTQFELADEQEREVIFIIGAADSTDEARRLILGLGGPVGARQALDDARAYWEHVLGTMRLETPDRALDVLTNGWLTYQVLSSRLWGRSGYYQSGGAYGFRDQLQDGIALLYTAPALTREHLLRCAERQFRDGDVQHWWHPPTGHGVRSRSADDYLWLPWAVAHYVRATGDTGVLDERAAFIEGRGLGPQEEAYYDQPQRSTEVAPLYDHCVRALNRGLHFGRHGLPLIGSGDWNDGMNLIGLEGRGESVWLAWFLYDNLRMFEDLARSRGDDHFVEVCAGQAEELRTNVEAHGWDGNWYLRAYFDDYTPLGSHVNDECRIDSIAQSWAVISGAGGRAHVRKAMASVDKLLVDREAGLVRLLDPPFDKSSLEPGYIKGYLPGVRENGGQYTHAAVWAAMAFAQMGEVEKAWELFRILSPISHSADAAGVETYKVEPYVMPADIYSIPPHTGRGGWTWYTGAAGWMYRLVVDTLLGIHLEGERLRLLPRVPDNWDSYAVHYRFRETTYHITLTRRQPDVRDTGRAGGATSGSRASGGASSGRRGAGGASSGRRAADGVEPVSRMAIDGLDLPQNSENRGVIPLVDDGREHLVEVTFG